MGYTRVKQLSAGHNSVDYHEKCPRGPGERGSPGKQSAAHNHHRRARGGWGGRVGSLRARRVLAQQASDLDALSASGAEIDALIEANPPE